MGVYSLGCKVIFLLGGIIWDEFLVVMFVRSGDVVFMVGFVWYCFYGMFMFLFYWVFL